MCAAPSAETSKNTLRIEVRSFRHELQERRTSASAPVAVGLSAAFAVAAAQSPDGAVVPVGERRDAARAPPAPLGEPASTRAAGEYLDALDAEVRVCPVARLAARSSQDLYIIAAVQQS